ncbi:hypothetical protein GGI42DRAFT_314310 [Trichoderma sp. SZMC 28013]
MCSFVGPLVVTGRPRPRASWGDCHAHLRKQASSSRNIEAASRPSGKFPACSGESPFISAALPRLNPWAPLSFAYQIGTAGHPSHPMQYDQQQADAGGSISKKALSHYTDQRTEYRAHVSLRTHINGSKSCKQWHARFLIGQQMQRLASKKPEPRHWWYQVANFRVPMKSASFPARQLERLPAPSVG